MIIHCIRLKFVKYVKTRVDSSSSSSFCIKKKGNWGRDYKVENQTFINKVKIQVVNQLSY